jgi:predicted metalloprotease
MRIEGQRQSTNIEDRRGMRMSGPVGIGGGGIGTILIILLISWFTGLNPLSLLDMSGGIQSGAPPQQTDVPTGSGGNDPQSRFISVVLADMEDTWTELFAKAGSRYQAPVLVLFNEMVQSACGSASAATGPFYCPADGKVYLDLSFFRELDQNFGAPGDFAQAYVIAHEIGHHVQNLLGISDEVRQRQQAASSQAEANQWSVRLELQADCLAGVWAHSVYARGDLEPGDVEEGLAAAAAVGDDRIQEQAGMSVDPETWTHGSSAERQEWFDRGFESGESSECNTFS